MAGKNTTDVALYLGFWSLYGPIAVAGWYYEKASLLKLAIILLIGLGIILGFLFVKNRLAKKEKQATKAPEAPKQSSEMPVAFFDNVFKPDFGRVEYDLD